MLTCKVVDCKNQRRRKGYCDHHWYCWFTYGDPLKEKWPKHGLYNSPEHRSWVQMRQRCNNDKSIGWTLYGGRGIKVCDRWYSSFLNFYDDMGAKPTPKHSIDRINVDGDYEPGNCRWATIHEQAANHRNNNAVVGVSFDKQTGKWMAQLIVDNKSVIRPRRYKTYDEAVTARHNAEVLYLDYN